MQADAFSRALSGDTEIQGTSLEFSKFRLSLLGYSVAISLTTNKVENIIAINAKTAKIIPNITSPLIVCVVCYTTRHKCKQCSLKTQSQQLKR